MRITPFGPMVASPSPALLKTLLDEYARRLRDSGVPFDEWLSPGISRDEIVSELSKVGLGCPDELVTWFEWRNGRVPGVPRERSVHSMPFFNPISLHGAVRRYTDSVLNFQRPPGTSLTDEFFQFGVTKG